MKVFAPSYYKKFSCVADKCKHSCCIGWEIDIDETTFEQYKNIHTEFGEKLKNNIIINNDCISFKLCKNERCPFLNKNNLCEIILNLGENALCQICSDHPRFRNYYSDRIEIGLGLCCEEVSRLIINENTLFKLIEIDYDNEKLEAYEDEISFFKLRDEIFEIVESNSQFNCIVKEILDNFDLKFPQKATVEWVDIFLKLERLDSTWDELLESIRNFDNIQDIPLYSNDNAIKNLFTYFIYRHLGESIYDGNFEGRLLFAILSCYMIITLNGVNSNIENIARMYSSEIEYSNENLYTLIEILQRESLEA